MHAAMAVGISPSLKYTSHTYKYTIPITSHPIRSDMMVMGNKLYDFVVTRRNLTADLGQIRTPSGDYVLYRVFTTLTG